MLSGISQKNYSVGKDISFKSGTGITIKLIDYGDKFKKAGENATAATPPTPAPTPTPDVDAITRDLFNKGQAQDAAREAGEKQDLLNQMHHKEYLQKLGIKSHGSGQSVDQILYHKGPTPSTGNLVEDALNWIGHQYTDICNLVTGKGEHTGSALDRISENVSNIRNNVTAITDRFANNSTSPLAKITPAPSTSLQDKAAEYAIGKNNSDAIKVTIEQGHRWSDTGTALNNSVSNIKDALAGISKDSGANEAMKFVGNLGNTTHEAIKFVGSLGNNSTEGATNLVFSIFHNMPKMDLLWIFQHMPK